METKRIGVTKDEMKLVLRSYFEHLANWVTILNEVKENKHILPQNVQELYTTSPTNKLRRRMSDLINRLLSLPDSKLNEEDLNTQDLVQKIKAQRQDVSRKEHPSTKKRKQMGSSMDCLNAKNSTTHEVTDVNTEQPGGSGLNKCGYTVDDRQSFVNLSDSSDGESTTPPAKKRSNAEISREANMEYLRFSRERLPNILDKMEKCMDKFLKN